MRFFNAHHHTTFSFMDGRYAKFCSECGRKLGWRNQDGVCIKCKDGRYCTDCGSKISRRLKPGLCKTCTIIKRNKMGWSRDRRKSFESERIMLANYLVDNGGDGASFSMPPRGSRLYNRYHNNVQLCFGKATQYGCWFCDAQATEWAWIHDSDPSDVNSYIALCYESHQEYDGKWNESERRKVSESLKDYWNSEDGMARRERMRVRKNRGGRR